MVVVQLASSPFFGGPERQMLGLAQSLSPVCRSIFVQFPDKGKSATFRRQLLEDGLETVVLARDTPHVRAMVEQLTGLLRQLNVSVLCCHGFKADLIGLLAARCAGIPVISVSRGWTWETWKVRLYEAIDRVCLRQMDRVVCVSEGQAVKVRAAGVATDRVVVVHNAIDADRFVSPDPAVRAELLAMFSHAPERIVGAAGRLSPEKGFGVLVEAAAIVARSDPGVGFVHFGDGPLRETLARRIATLGLGERFVLAGFRDDLDRFLPHWDLSVLPSFTEGLPNVVLESYAAGVPVVATAVGGIPEVVADGVDGYLVAPGDPAALAGRIVDVLRLGDARRAMGQYGRERIEAQFTFAAQALRYRNLFEQLISRQTAASVADDAIALESKEK